MKNYIQKMNNKIKKLTKDELIDIGYQNTKTNWLKRLFCKHDYTKNEELQMHPGVVLYYECKKCGKEKQSWLDEE